MNKYCRNVLLQNFLFALLFSSAHGNVISTIYIYILYKRFLLELVFKYCYYYKTFYRNTTTIAILVRSVYTPRVHNRSRFVIIVKLRNSILLRAIRHHKYVY